MRWIVLVLVLAAATAAARGIRVEFEAEKIEAENLLLSGVHADIDSRSGAFSLRIDELTVSSGTPLRDLSIHCDQGSLDLKDIGLVCDDARVSLNHSLVKLHQSRAKIRLQAGQGGEIELYDVPLLGDGIRVQASPEEGRWRIQASAPSVDAVQLSSLAADAGLALTGMLQLSADMLIGDDLTEIRVEAVHSALGFQDVEGRYLGEGLDGGLALRIRRDGGDWLGSLEGRWERGEMLFPAAYVQPEKAHPLELTATLAAPANLSSLEISDYRLSQKPWVRLRGKAEFGLESATPVVRRLSADLDPLALDSVYQRYLAPLFIHPAASVLELSGRLDGRVLIANGALAEASLKIEQVSASAETGNTRFALEALNADMELGRGGRGSGELSWKSARLFDFDIGATRLPFRVQKQALSLERRAAIPLFDGSLDIGELTFDWSATPRRLTFDAVLTPVSMEKVSLALGWIPMQGQLSGVIPRVSLSGGELALDGALLMQVFDGNVVIRHLTVSDLFGYWPVLDADAQCRNLDLELLTGTYEFGRITGRIDGDIRALKLENWRPTAFDARFASSPGDGSSHRISQKAVDSIVSLSGSGMPGVLSRGFLKFFDEFRYDRLGIACRLQSGVCEMDGVEPADSGYYLVKGGGIPRIDVIGFNRFTDWDVLLERLQAVTSGGPPVIQ